MKSNGQTNTAAANMGVAIAGVPCFADTFVVSGSSVLRTKFSAKTPRHRKPPKRYGKGYLNDTIKEQNKTLILNQQK